METLYWQMPLADAPGRLLLDKLHGKLSQGSRVNFEKQETAKAVKLEMQIVQIFKAPRFQKFSDE